MHRAHRTWVALAGFLLVIGTASSGAATIIIDDFSAGALNFAGAGSTANVFVAGSMSGGERDERLVNTAPSGGILAGATGGAYEYGAVNATGNVTLTWDGVDGSPTLNATGLGGIDLTESGLNDVIMIEILANDFAANILLTVYTTASDYSQIQVASPGGIPSGPAIFLTAAFVNFTAVGAGANFANVGAITMQIDGSLEPQLDMTIGTIGATDLASVPEPAPVVLMLMGLAVLAAGGRHKQGFAC